VEDPQHRNNQFAEHKDVAEALHAKFVAWLTQTGTASKHLEPRLQL
jgi:hypothetical protein